MTLQEVIVLREKLLDTLAPLEDAWSDAWHPLKGVIGKEVRNLQRGLQVLLLVEALLDTHAAIAGSIWYNKTIAGLRSDPHAAATSLFNSVRHDYDERFSSE